MSLRIRIILVDDHHLRRECLASALAKEPDLHLSSEAEDVADALMKTELNGPEIMLIDAGLPSNGALELVREMRQRFTDVKLIILGLTEAKSVVLQSLEAGADSYFPADGSYADLLALVRSVHQGGAVCSPELAYMTFLRIADLASKRKSISLFDESRLTRREVEILQLIAYGLNNREIAKRLYLSDSTVKNHVHNILDKLQVHNRSEAVERAFCIRRM